MLVAGEDRGLQIEEIPAEEILKFEHPVADHDEVLRILAEAVKQRPGCPLGDRGLGPWGVRGEP
jgi:hypothetical protein